MKFAEQFNLISKNLIISLLFICSQHSFAVASHTDIVDGPEILPITLDNNHNLNITITGSITVSNVAVTADGNNVDINNFGEISSSTAILNKGNLKTLINSGKIIGTSYGVNNLNNEGGNPKITDFNNSGTISGDYAGIGNQSSSEIITLSNSGIISGLTYGIENLATKTITIINSGTISGGVNSIKNSGPMNLTLNKDSRLIGTFSNSGTLNITANLGASKSYAYTGTVTSLIDLNNRPSALGSAAAINIGSMEMAGENLYQKTENIADFIIRNFKNDKDSWLEPYYSKSSRNSEGDSSQIRQFENDRQGINAGFKVEGSAMPLQFVLNIDQTKNNIDSSEHLINSDSIMIGLVAPNYEKYEGFDVSVKGLVGYSNSKTVRKILDNSTSTGENVLTGEYESYYAILGTALSKSYNLSQDVDANLTFGADLTSEFRESYGENLYFFYNNLELIQLQPRIQVEFLETISKDSNLFLTAQVGARKILAGNTQKYAMNNTAVSFGPADKEDYYTSFAVGTNMNVGANVNFYALVSAEMSDRDTDTYQASIGLKGTF